MGKHSDSEKKSIIIEHLMWDDSIHSRDIHVEVEGKLAKLQGSVPNYAVKLAAERVAMLVEGINKVENYLSIQFPPETSNIPDEEIGQHIVNVLNSDSRFNSDKVIVSVDRGTVNLKGTINSLWAKRTIGEMCNSINGVLEVDNQLGITLSDVWNDEDIKMDIQKAFDRSMLFDANKVFIEVKDGVVKLTGALPNTIARREAYNIALYTKSVKEVENSIAIGNPY